MSQARFSQCMGDEGVFVSNNNTLRFKDIIGTWVNDLVRIVPNDTDLNQLEVEIEKYVKLKRHRELSKLLGM